MNKFLYRRKLPIPQSLPNKTSFTAGRKVFILGSGRAGTSFLTNLLANCGLDAGLSQLSWYNNTRSGWEWNHETVLRGNSKTSYLIKNPHLTNHIDELYSKYTIDCVILPIRYSKDCVRSRERNFNDTSMKEEDIELQTGKLLSKLVYYNIPFVIIAYPKIIKDAKYAHQKINEIMAIIGKEPVEEEKFQSIYSQLVFK